MMKQIKTRRLSINMIKIPLLCIFLLIVTSFNAHSEQYKTLGSWDVHYIVINTSFLTPNVAKAYNIQRSKYQGLVNISVLDKDSHTAQSIAMTGTATNLLGTKKTLSFKEVKDGDAIYYLAILPFRDLEQYRFDINIVDGNKTQKLKFKHKFFAD